MSDAGARSAGPIIGLLLAAGRGLRFDPDGMAIKLLAQLPDGRRMVAASAENLCAALDHVVVIAPADEPRRTAIEAALSALPLNVVPNLRADEGIGASIAAGVAEAIRRHPDALGWVIALGDMPYIEQATIARLRDALFDSSSISSANGSKSSRLAETAEIPTPRPTLTTTQTTIFAPTFGGQRGHPVAFAACHAAELTRLDGDAGAQALLAEHGVQLLPTEDAGILRDIDTKLHLTSPAP